MTEQRSSLARVAAVLLALAPPLPARADDIVPGVPLSSSLTEGSELAAGLDPNAGEISHPAVRTDVAAALRNLGGVWAHAQGSAAVQFNPYFVFAGSNKLYDDATSFRKSLPGAWIQDTSIAASVGIGTPFDDSTRSSARFSTVGLGAAIELLGQRSFYSEKYSKCLHSTSKKYEDFVRTIAIPAATIPGQPPKTTPAEETVKLQQQLDALAKKAADALDACDATAFDKSTALFLSTGGRWVTVGPERQPGDGIRIQRSFVGLTVDQLINGAFGLSAQVRLIGSRATMDGAVETTGDLGVSVRYASRRVQLLLDWSDAFSNGESPGTAIYHSRLLFAVTDELGIELFARGSGASPAAALRAILPGVSISYQKKQVARFGNP